MWYTYSQENDYDYHLVGVVRLIHTSYELALTIITTYVQNHNIGNWVPIITALGFSKRDTQNYVHIHNTNMYTCKRAMKPVWGSY
jgi:hypothetical protein